MEQEPIRDIDINLSSDCDNQKDEAENCFIKEKVKINKKGIADSIMHIDVDISPSDEVFRKSAKPLSEEPY